jgi:hypothetical protein
MVAEHARNFPAHPRCRPDPLGWPQAQPCAQPKRPKINDDAKINASLPTRRVMHMFRKLSLAGVAAIVGGQGALAPTSASAWRHRSWHYGWHGGWRAARALLKAPIMAAGAGSRPYGAGGCAGSADRLLARPILPAKASGRRVRGLESLFNFVFPPDRRTQS